jgi:hypothetical protein
MRRVIPNDVGSHPAGVKQHIGGSRVAVEW